MQPQSLLTVTLCPQVDAEPSIHANLTVLRCLQIRSEPINDTIFHCVTFCPQVDEEPSIRANTTVLLGNMASYLGESTCKRVLLNAFTRALKVRGQACYVLRPPVCHWLPLNSAIS